MTASLLTHAATAPPPRVPLRLEGVEVALGGAPVLHHVDLTLPTGRTLALLGPSGCGKTTLLRTIAGLQPADRGRVVIDGVDVTRVAPERRGVGMVFQDGALFPHMRVAENVAFGLDRRQRRGPAAEDALAMVGLAGFGQRMPATLSGGQQQRVALARALVTRPRVLLLDEPFSSLDTGLRVQVRSEVAALLHDLAITAVVVTHDQEEAFLMGDEVAVMIDGTVHQHDTPAQLYAAPATRDVARFLGDANLVAAEAEGAEARTWLGTVPLRSPAAGPVEVLIRPEDLRLRAGTRLVVRDVAYYGHDAVTTLECEAGVVAVRTLSRPPAGVGDRVDVEYTGPATMAYRQ